MSQQAYHRVWVFLLALSGLLGVAIAALGFWLSHDSSRFLRPEFWQYDPLTGQAILRREVLSDETVWAEWRHDIVTEISGLECSAEGTAPYEPFEIEKDENGDMRVALDEHGEPIPKIDARFPLPEGLRPCVYSGEGYFQRASWSVLWNDWLPLRPVELEQTFTLTPPATQKRIEQLEQQIQTLQEMKQ